MKNLHIDTNISDAEYQFYFDRFLVSKKHHSKLYCIVPNEETIVEQLDFYSTKRVLQQNTYILALCSDKEVMKKQKENYHSLEDILWNKIPGWIIDSKYN